MGVAARLTMQIFLVNEKKNIETGQKEPNFCNFSLDRV
jgi:hypothetical protein